MKKIPVTFAITYEDAEVFRDIEAKFHNFCIENDLVASIDTERKDTPALLLSRRTPQDSSIINSCVIHLALDKNIKQ